MIQISKLPLIVSPEIFFEVEKILFIDVIDMSTASIFMKIRLEAQYGAFAYKGRFYLPISLFGKPENLFLKVKSGVSINLGEGESMSFTFDGDLLAALAQKKIYDFTEYRAVKNPQYAKELDFLYERYISPYL